MSDVWSELMDGSSPPSAVEGSFTEVEPTNHRTNPSGREYHDEYTYLMVNVAAIDVDEIREDVPDGVTLGYYDSIYVGDEDMGECVMWSYDDDPPVFISRLQCYVSDRSLDRHTLERCEKQCYHALSVLDSLGYVSFWRRV